MIEEDFYDDNSPGIYSDLPSSQWLQEAVNQSVRQEMHRDPELCACRGYGWISSDYDTWHECRYHPGHPHPEFEDFCF